MAKIPNDVKASELVSKSLSGVLDADEEVALKEYIAQTDESRSFSRLSSLIHQSVIDMAGESVGPATEEKLSDIAKARLRQSIRTAKLESMAAPSDASLKVAEPKTDTTYVISDPNAMPVEEERGAVCRFTLIQKIGEGGLGTVWLARDEKLRRNVALKEMNPGVAASPKLTRRFQREAEITGHLEHPNVVPLYMSGVNPETQLPFYAMRFLGKRTLAEAIREYHARRQSGVDDPLDLHRLLNAFLDVCQAIAFAHSRGVIHRDLKPENVALDSFGQVLVLDWGLAKLDGDGELAMRMALSGNRDDSHLGQTLDGDVVGTPLYMAPEQAAGNLDQVDARTDVYGLGAILFDILTGNAPHENSHKSSGGTLKVRDFLQAIATSETPRPRDLNVSVPCDLEAICMRAMAKQKFARHASATELASEVERWIAGKHEKEARYDAMRMTARDLKSRLCVQIRQLAAAAQFMVELPPIQGLLTSIQNDREEFATWRDRLSQILLALAKSKPNISGLSYSQVTDDRIHELTRIERSLYDVANVRSLPQSRLRRGVANTFHKIVMQQFPGESSIDFDCMTAGTVRIVCGVPVFDAETEEPFGFVGAEAEVGNLVRPELEVIGAQDTVYLIDDFDNILFTSSRESAVKESVASDHIPDWSNISQSLANSAEFIDPARQIHATRLPYSRSGNSIRIVFQIEDG